MSSSSACFVVAGSVCTGIISSIGGASVLVSDSTGCVGVLISDSNVHNHSNSSSGYSRVS